MPKDAEIQKFNMLLFGNNLPKKDPLNLKLDSQSFASLCFAKLMEQGHSFEEIVSDNFAEQRRQVVNEICDVFDTKSKDEITKYIIPSTLYDDKQYAAITANIEQNGNQILQDIDLAVRTNKVNEFKAKDSQSLAPLAKKLENAKTFYNSSEYKELIGMVKSFDKFEKMLAEKPDTKNLEIEKKYALSLFALKNQVDKYLTHKAKEGVKQNSYKKLAAVEELNQFVSKRIKDLNPEAFTVGKLECNPNKVYASYSDELKANNYQPYLISKSTMNDIQHNARFKGFNVDKNELNYVQNCMGRIINLAQGQKIKTEPFVNQMKTYLMKPSVTGEPDMKPEKIRQMKIDGFKALGNYMEAQTRTEPFGDRDAFDHVENPLGFSVSRSAIMSFSEAAMLRDGYSLDDVLNPALYKDEKQKYAKEVIGYIESGNGPEILKLIKTGCEKTKIQMDKMLTEMPSFDDSALLNPKYRNLCHASHFFKDLTQEYRNIPKEAKVDVTKEDAIMKNYASMGDAMGWFALSANNYIKSANKMLNGKADYGNLESDFESSLVTHKYINSIFKDMKKSPEYDKSSMINNLIHSDGKPKQVLTKIGNAKAHINNIFLEHQSAKSQIIDNFDTPEKVKVFGEALFGGDVNVDVKLDDKSQFGVKLEGFGELANVAQKRVAEQQKLSLS